MESQRKPILIAGLGFSICLLSFILGASIGKSAATTVLFYAGFVICAFGVLLGFIVFRRDQ